MLEIAAIALPNLLDFGVDVFGANRKEKQAKKQKELLTQQTIAAYEEDKSELLLKDKIKKEGQINLLNQNLGSSKANFAANGIRQSASADNLLKAKKENALKEMQDDDKILNLNLQNLYNAMQRSIASQKFDYQNTVSDKNFGIAKSGIDNTGKTLGWKK